MAAVNDVAVNDVTINDIAVNDIAVIDIAVKSPQPLRLKCYGPKVSQPT